MLRRSYRRRRRIKLVGVCAWLILLLASLPRTAEAVNTTFTNSSQITITDNSKAAPYPSTIMVNVPVDTTTRIGVNLRFLSHTVPDDVDILLVGPTGARSILMSDAGGNSAAMQSGIGFAASAMTVIPDNGPLPASQESQLYRPANYGSGIPDVFPTPGPGSLIDAPADLNVFKGLNPNGEWKLYVVDDSPSGAGAILSGWEIPVTHPAIVVAADNVTLDLNGFSILGPTVCTGSPTVTSCSPLGTGNGIDATGHANFSLMNGTVQGMGNNGVIIRTGRSTA